MASLVQYLALIAVLCLGWHVLSLVIRILVGDRPTWLKWLAARYRRPAPSPPTPLVLHELELARLAEMVQATHETIQPARAFRVNAASAAYDMELVEACRTLGLDSPSSHPPFTAQDRFDTEMKLLGAGLSW